MSLKRILGVMLASRMAGRGRGTGGLGRTAMLGGLGGGMGRKAGMAGLAYMAYRAYRDHQARQPGGSGGGTGGSGSDIGGMISGLADKLTGNPSQDQKSDPSRQGGRTTSDTSADHREQELAAEAISEDTALLLLRGMIAAANADGSISPEERGRIIQQVEESGGNAEDRRTVERELDNPKPLDTLLTQISDHETAEEFYLASRAAVDAETESSRAYLADLRRRLNLTEDEAQEIDALAS